MPIDDTRDRLHFFFLQYITMLFHVLNILCLFKASNRPQSEAGESTISVFSKSIRPPTTISISVSTNQPQQKRQQKKSNDERVTLFSHLTIYTRNLDNLPITS